MKIKKFNEDIQYNFGYEKCEESKYSALIFYDAGGTVTECILFDDWNDLQNYITNYVNNFIDSEEIVVVYDHSFDKKDLKNNEFTDWESAFLWFNHYSKDTEPTIDIIDNCKYAKDIKLGEWKSIKAGKNYNL